MAGSLRHESATLDEAPVTGDAVLLERLVTNLLDNAERYNIAGGTIEISTAAHDTTSVLRVVNTGAVVPADMVEHLFQPFTRLHDRTRHDGFGLGLTLVSSIAAVYGGTVHATAVPTGGLDISVRLPRRDRTMTPLSRKGRLSRARGRAGRGGWACPWRRARAGARRA